MTITELQQAAVDAITAAIPSLSQCEIYGGQFGSNLGDRVAIHAPAVLVAALGCKPISDPGIAGQMDISCRMAAYVLAQHHGDRSKREGACIDMVEHVATIIHNNNFNAPLVSPAKVIQMQGQTNASADDAGFALWSVVWEQQTRIGAAPVSNYGPLTDVKIGIAPNIGIGHEPDYAPI